MNVYLNINDIKKKKSEITEIDLQDNIRYLYPKKNTIMEGEFTKILFSKEYVTMNGIYLHLPFVVDTRKIYENNHIRFLVQNNVQNNNVVSDLKMIEKTLLTNYSDYYKIKKQFEYTLSRQLHSNQIRVYHDISNKSRRTRYVIKISGIWESVDKIGLTFKILEL